MRGALETRLARPVALAFETRFSGPSPEDDPFRDGRADLAFVCGPSYPLLRAAGSPVALLPAAPVFEDPRAGGRPVYFSDVVVRRESPVSRFEELAGLVWAYNDRLSRSGWQNMEARLSETGRSAGGVLRARRTFGIAPAVARPRRAGRGRRGGDRLEHVLWLERRRDPEKAARLRVLESWGPMPIQPVIARAGLPPEPSGTGSRAFCSRSRRRVPAPRLAECGLVRFASVRRSDYARSARSRFRRREIPFRDGDAALGLSQARWPSPSRNAVSRGGSAAAAARRASRRSRATAG